MTALCRTDSASYHDPESDSLPEWALNAAQEQVEDDAETEAYAAAPAFAEWTANLDETEIAAILAAALKRRRGGVVGDQANDTLDRMLDMVLLDYKSYRVAMTDLEQIAAELEHE